MTTKKRLTQIDGLKFVFCIGIVLVHYYAILVKGQPENAPYWSLLNPAFLSFTLTQTGWNLDYGDYGVFWMTMLIILVVACAWYMILEKKVFRRR